MYCKLCNKNSDYIEAYIIPKSFYKSYINEGPLFLFPKDKDLYSKRSRKGVYDDNIICANCEKIFMKWDDYAQKILLKTELKQFILDNSNEWVYSIDGVDYGTLKMFFVSLLWRASVSNHTFFKEVRTGPFEASLREMIIEGNPGESDDFSVIITKFTKELSIAATAPYRTKLMSVNFYRFFFSNYEIYIKVDSQKTPSTFVPIILKSNPPLLILPQPPVRSKDMKILIDIAKRFSKKT